MKESEQLVSVEERGEIVSFGMKEFPQTVIFDEDIISRYGQEGIVREGRWIPVVEKVEGYDAPENEEEFQILLESKIRDFWEDVIEMTEGKKLAVRHSLVMQHDRKNRRFFLRMSFVLLE